MFVLSRLGFANIICCYNEIERFKFYLDNISVIIFKTSEIIEVIVIVSVEKKIGIHLNNTNCELKIKDKEYSFIYGYEYL